MPVHVPHRGLQHGSRRSGPGPHLRNRKGRNPCHVSAAGGATGRGCQINKRRRPHEHQDAHPDGFLGAGGARSRQCHLSAHKQGRRGNGQCYAHRRLPIPSARTFCALETPLPKAGCLPAALLSPTKPSVAGPCCRLPERACSGWSPMTPPPEIGNGVHTAHAFVRHVNSKPTTGRTPWMPRATGLVLRALVRLARIDAQAGGLR